MLRALLAGAALLAGLAAAAAAPDQTKMFQGYLAAPSYRMLVAKAYVDDEPALLKAQCAALKIVSLDPPQIVEAPLFVNGPRGWYTQSGAWVQRATMDRCGKPAIRRLLVETHSDNTLHMQELLPGEYAGGYKLEAAARSYAVDSMNNVMNCKDWKNATVVDIKLNGKFDPQHWTETWTALICGKTVTALVDYKKNGVNGADYDIVTSKIKGK